MTLLYVISECDLHFWCAQDHTRAIPVSELLAMKNPPETTEVAKKRAVCKACGGKAVEYRIVWAGTPNNRPPR